MAISFLVARGFLCCQRRRSGFKLALVVGYRENDMRVCYWRAVSKQWTKPAVVSSDDLDHLNTEDKKKHERAITQATSAAIEKKIVVRVWT